MQRFEIVPPGYKSVLLAHHQGWRSSRIPAARPKHHIEGMRQLRDIDTELQNDESTTDLQKPETSAEHDIPDETLSIPLRIVKNFSTVW
jgi:hypothetical protein